MFQRRQHLNEAYNSVHLILHLTTHTPSKCYKCTLPLPTRCIVKRTQPCRWTTICHSGTIAPFIWMGYPSALLHILQSSAQATLGCLHLVQCGEQIRGWYDECSIFVFICIMFHCDWVCVVLVSDIPKCEQFADFACRCVGCQKHTHTTLSLSCGLCWWLVLVMHDHGEGVHN